MIAGNTKEHAEGRDMEFIPDRLEQIKKEFGLNNVELAEAAGVTKAAVGRWLNEGIIPKRPALVRLRENLGISELWLIEGKGPMKVRPDESFILSVRSVAGGLNDEAKRQVLDYMRYLASQDSDKG